jgi:creatinine amidohydrolase
MRILMIAFGAILAATPCSAQSSAQWEDLTGPDFIQAITKADGTCGLPFGVIEKHGPSGPLATDLINVRAATLRAAQEEFIVVFPPYYFGQIAEARHQPGTIAYSSRLQLDLLQETVGEMARNGCRKVVIVNGHGGNTMLLQYFVQTQLDSAKDYVVYVVQALRATGSEDENLPPAARPSKPNVDGHAGEQELSRVMAVRPELAHPERSSSESGADLHRVRLPNGVLTAISWYASFPNHYQGDSSGATAVRGEALTQMVVKSIAGAVRAIKEDDVTARLQADFFAGVKSPLKTKQ